MQISFELTLPAVIKKKNKYYIASCPILDVITQGRNKTEAKNNLIDALQLFITSCLERNVLDDVLNEAGIKPTTVTSHFKKRRMPQNCIPIPVKIPLELLNNNSAPCHA